jgi:hypothetical protein
MKPNASSLRRVGLVMPTAKNVGWMLGGIALSTMFAVSAQQFIGTGSAEVVPCDLNDEISRVLNRQIATIAATTPDPAVYFQVGGDSSCLGDISLANLDLSRLIPDPLGLLGDAVTTAVTKLTNAAISKVCKAGSKTMSQTIGQYNGYLGQNTGVTGDSILATKLNNVAESTVAKVGGADFAVDYRAAAPDILAGVKLPSNTITSQPQGAYASGSALASDTAQSVSAAAVVEQARLNLIQSRSAFASSGGSIGSDAVAGAENAYSMAAQNLDSLRKKVGDYVSSSNAAPQQAQPVVPATVGSSIFGGR